MHTQYIDATYVHEVYSQKDTYIRKTKKKFQNARPSFRPNLNDKDDE